MPLLAAVGESVAAGLALETLRIAEGGDNLRLDGATGSLAAGTHRLPLSVTADLRVRPSPPDTWPARTVSATDVAAGLVPPERFSDRIVLLGGSAAALGGLRPAAASPVTPSVQIQADALETMLAGEVPHRPPEASIAELAAAGLLALAAACFGALFGPVMAAMLTAAFTLVWFGGAVAALVQTGLVLDPLGPGLAAAVALIGSGTTAAVLQRRAAAALRRRFERHLSPAVVDRIAARPDLLKLGGERREVTVLFTDIEGFTAVTERIGPTELVKLLDAYFEGVIDIVVAHGGMVDKIVGDAVHALFNAPVDLPDHPRKAVEAALAVTAFSHRFRERSDARAAGFGRTRLGIETGEVVIGDVGAGAKLDYTAHGSAVNTAARLEAANKELGSTICVGPVCRSRLPDVAFRSLGTREIRGVGPLELYEPLAQPRTLA